MSAYQHSRFYSRKQGSAVLDCLDQPCPLTAIEEADLGMSTWDMAVFLLHTAAEVEHSLLVQYLYAAWSINDLPQEGSATVDQIKERIKVKRELLGIAREEMAHFMTVQNILRFIGAPLNFEREDFPIQSRLYPFPFKLEPLSEKSLSKYIVAEMPEPAVLLNELKVRLEAPSVIDGEPAGIENDQIVVTIEALFDHSNVDRIGRLYSMIIDLFCSGRNESGQCSCGLDECLDKGNLANRGKGSWIPDSCFSADTKGYQGRAEDWFGYGPMIVKQVDSRKEAIEALQAVAEQGKSTGGGPPSHYQRFLKLKTKYGNLGDGAIKNICINPSTHKNHFSKEGGNSAQGYITNEETRAWAQLFNLRYRILLLNLHHFLILPGPLVDEKEKKLEQPETHEDFINTLTLKGHLYEWIFTEMTGFAHEGMRSGLRGIGQHLMTLPLARDDNDLKAGPPFELPNSLSLPNKENELNNLHLNYINKSQDLIWGKIFKKIPKEIDDLSLWAFDNPTRHHLLMFPSNTSDKVFKEIFKKSQEVKKYLEEITKQKNKEIKSDNDLEKIFTKIKISLKEISDLILGDENVAEKKKQKLNSIKNANELLFEIDIFDKKRERILKEQSKMLLKAESELHN